MRGEVGLWCAGQYRVLVVLQFLFSFSFSLSFSCAWVGPIDLLLRDLIVRICHPIGGGPPYLNVNAGSLTLKKKKKKKKSALVLLLPLSNKSR